MEEYRYAHLLVHDLYSTVIHAYHMGENVMKFYKISCWILAGVFVVVLILTMLSNQTHYRKADPDSVTRENCIYYYVDTQEVKGSDGTVMMKGGYVRVSDYLPALMSINYSEYEAIEADYTRMGPFYETYLLFDGVVLYILLATVALLLVICVCISRIYGGTTYKLGFFVLHGGLAVLLVGFILQSALMQSVSFILDVDGNYLTSDQPTVYTDSRDALKQLDLGVEMSAVDMDVQYYENGMEKEYTLTLETRKSIDDPAPVSYELKINHPIRINGHKIYLMSYVKADPATGYYSDAVVLMAKYNPMEYTIIFGMLTTLAGSIVMCLFRKDGGKNDE